LLRVLLDLKDEAVQFAVIVALAPAARVAEESMALRAIHALGEAGRNGSHVVGSDSNLREILRRLTQAFVWAPEPRIAEAALDTVLQTVIAHSDRVDLDMTVAIEFGMALPWVPEQSADDAVAKLLNVTESGEKQVSGIALIMLCSAISQSTELRAAHLVRTVLAGIESWHAADRSTFFFRLEHWLTKGYAPRSGMIGINALASAFPYVEFEEIRKAIIDLVISAFEESTTGMIQSETIAAMEEIALSTRDPETHAKIVDIMRESMWLNAVNSTNALSAVTLLIKVGVKCSSVRLKAELIETLASILLEHKIPIAIWAFYDKVIDGMRAVAYTDTDPKLRNSLVMHLAEIWTARPEHIIRTRVLPALDLDLAPDDCMVNPEFVRAVGAILLRNETQDEATASRAVEWLVRNVLKSSDEEVRKAAFETIVPLATKDGVEIVFEALHNLVFEDFTESGRANRGDIASHILALSSAPVIRHAMTTLCDVATSCPWMSMKMEVVDWVLAAARKMERPAQIQAAIEVLEHLVSQSDGYDMEIGARVAEAFNNLLFEATTPKTARFIMAGMVKICGKFDAMQIGSVVVEALSNATSRRDRVVARYAIRSLVRLAMRTESSELEHMAGRNIGRFVLHRDMVIARIAIRGLVTTSAKGDANLQAYAWDVLYDARFRERRAAILPDHLKACSELMRQKQEQVQSANEMPDAKLIAPAA